MKTSKHLKNSGSLVSYNSKKENPNERIQSGFNLEEEELHVIRSLLTKMEIKELDLKLNKKNNKNQVLKPLSKQNTKRETPININSKKNEELEKTNNEKMFEWKNDVNHLDDYQFRKTLTKKNEKLIIDDSTAQSYKENESQELTKFLRSINLLKYYNVFLENCFDDLYSILEIKENHLVEMNVSSDDINTILIEIKKIKENENTFIARNSQIENTSNMKKNENISEVAIGSDDLMEEINKIEEEERRLFQKAVEEYRNSLKNNNISIVREDKLQKTHTKMDQGIGTYEIGSINMKIKKLSCWECYKIKNSDDMLKSEYVQNKFFCSYQCKINFDRKNIVNCERCEKLFEKVSGFIKNNKIYCEENCSKQNSEKEIFRNISKKEKSNYDPMADF